MRNFGLFDKHNDLLTRVLAFIAVLLLFSISIVIWDNLHNERPTNAPAFTKAGLSIKREDGKYFSYSVEVATTQDQQMYGLMYRHSLPPDAGMIFIYNPDQPVSMWMKNTYVPLDMLFVRKDGTIAHIATNAQPLDLTPISFDEPVRAVIEITAGDVEKNSFHIGDKVLFSAFSNAP